jgi:microcompartment protein CcmK/EutM
MQLGCVIGRVWATVKNQGLEGQRLLFVEPVTPDLRSAGKPLICADCTGAGAGEIVYWCRGRESSFAFLPAEVPTDATIVAILDELQAGGETHRC